jgi:hypothetical protein
MNRTSLRFLIALLGIVASVWFFGAVAGAAYFAAAGIFFLILELG